MLTKTAELFVKNFKFFGIQGVIMGKQSKPGLKPIFRGIPIWHD
jgi:hypothetical protein